MCIKKEVLFISNFLGDGGAARVITVLADAFVKEEKKVTICSFPLDRKEYDKQNTIEYKLLGQKGKGIIKTITRIRSLRKEIKKHPDATIISFEYFLNMQTIISAAGLKKKIIVSERNDPKRKGGQFPKSFIRNFLYRFCDVLVCQTEDAKAYFPNYIQKKTIIIPNPVKDNLPEAYQGERNKTIVNFCRLEKQKNLQLLVDAFADFEKIHSDYRLEIYGDGGEKENLENYIACKEMKDKITLYEAVNDIHERIIDAAMFVSSSDYEGISNSMLEAMAIGIPVICTDCPCGGARMIIDNEKNGILTPVGDKDALAKSMCRIAENTELANSLSLNGQKIRDALSSDKIIKMWKKVVN